VRRHPQPHPIVILHEDIAIPDSRGSDEAMIQRERVVVEKRHRFVVEDIHTNIDERGNNLQDEVEED